MIKILSNPGTEGNFPNSIKGNLQKQTNIILNGMTLNDFPLRSGIKQGWQLSPLEVRVPIIAIGKKKNNKGHKHYKEKSKTVFADDMIVYVENPKEIYKKATRTN